VPRRPAGDHLGTLDVVIDTLFPSHPFDDVYSNKLISVRTTGWWMAGDPVRPERKPLALRELSSTRSRSSARPLSATARTTCP
jgi:hypothetical protein